MYASICLAWVGVLPENIQIRRVPWPKKFGKRCLNELVTGKRHNEVTETVA